MKETIHPCVMVRSQLFNKWEARNIPDPKKVISHRQALRKAPAKRVQSREQESLSGPS
jgi:hypothetical protein